MLIRVAPRFFQANTGDTVTIAAVAQNNNGHEAATFLYAGASLGDIQVQNHPACQFVVVHGINTFATMLFFDGSAPNASYDLFEVDAAGNLISLQVNAPAAAGRFTQFQLDGRPVQSMAAALRGEGAARMARAAAPAGAGPGQPMARGRRLVAAAKPAGRKARKNPGRKKAAGRKKPGKNARPSAAAAARGRR
jgi:hypothetical protein